MLHDLLPLTEWFCSVRFMIPSVSPARPSPAAQRPDTARSHLTGHFPASIEAFGYSELNSRSTSTALGVGKVLKVMLGVPSVLAVFSFLMIIRGFYAKETDGDTMQERWSGFAKKPARRMMSLMAGAARVGLIALRAKLIRDPKKKSAMHTRAGKRAVTELVRLGPTYVKLGQILSCREDLVPKEYINELSLHFAQIFWQAQQTHHIPPGGLKKRCLNSSPYNSKRIQQISKNINFG